MKVVKTHPVEVVHMQPLRAQVQVQGLPMHPLGLAVAMLQPYDVMALV